MAVVLAVIVAASGLTASQAFLTREVAQPFSEIAILGPSMKIGDYPKRVITGKPFMLYLYLGNHEGKAMYYAVLAKVGNQTTQINQTEPMDASIIACYRAVVLDDANCTRPVILSIDEAGVDYRLVFELWVYRKVSRDFKYHGRWCQLWLNATPLTTF